MTATLYALATGAYLALCACVAAGVIGATLAAGWPRICAVWRTQFTKGN